MCPQENDVRLVSLLQRDGGLAQPRILIATAWTVEQAHTDQSVRPLRIDLPPSHRRLLLLRAVSFGLQPPAAFHIAMASVRGMWE